jgi:hypothetical protein
MAHPILIKDVIPFLSLFTGLSTVSIQQNHFIQRRSAKIFATLPRTIRHLSLEIVRQPAMPSFKDLFPNLQTLRLVSDNLSHTSGASTDAWIESLPESVTFLELHEILQNPLAVAGYLNNLSRSVLEEAVVVESPYPLPNLRVMDLGATEQPSLILASCPPSVTALRVHKQIHTYLQNWPHFIFDEEVPGQPACMKFLFYEWTNSTARFPLEQLPRSLLALHLETVTQGSFEKLPPNLTSLSLPLLTATSTFELSEIPRSVTSLMLGSGSILSSIPNSLPNLTSLIVKSLGTHGRLSDGFIPKLPRSLTRFEMNGPCLFTSDIAQLPPGLTTLRAPMAMSPEAMLALPRGLRHLAILMQSGFHRPSMASLPPHLLTLHLQEDVMAPKNPIKYDVGHLIPRSVKYLQLPKLRLPDSVSTSPKPEPSFPERALQWISSIIDPKTEGLTSTSAMAKRCMEQFPEGCLVEATFIRDRHAYTELYDTGCITMVGYSVSRI